MEQREIKDLAISAAVLAFVFAYAYFGGITNIMSVIIGFPVMLLIISISFIFHELGHRNIAMKFNAYAEYRLWKNGLILAVIITVFTNGWLIFAAPGAVMIYTRADLWGRSAALSRQASGIISASGPVMNIIIAIAFFLLAALVPVSVLGIDVFGLGARINALLAFFNLLPIPPLDGSKILPWNIRIWAALFIPAIILYSLA